MFDSREEARAALKDLFDRPELVELFDSLVYPAIGFETTHDASTRLGNTRFGGTPDLPKTIEWPIRRVPDNAREIVERGGQHHGSWILQNISEEQPYSFVAQIDLAEAATFGDLAAQLPDSGRLLFFYDDCVGAWRDESDSCCVVWDTAPVDELQRCEIPKRLVELADAFRGKSAMRLRTMTPLQKRALARRTSTPARPRNSR